MLPRRLRLHKAGQFKIVFRYGKSMATRHLVVYAMKAKDWKIGFIASKKVGGSVQRNRAKRLMREAVRLDLPQFKDCHHLILIARKPIVTATLEEVKSSLRYVLKKTGVL